jgi:hypothetical protein
MFPGKRATNKEAFPGAIGYAEPRTRDDHGNLIDYSSVKYGGYFGQKLMHANEPMHVPRSAVWRVDRTAKYTDMRRTTSSQAAAAGVGGSGFSSRGGSPFRDLAATNMTALASTSQSLSRSNVNDNSMGLSSKPHVPSLQLPGATKDSSYRPAQANHNVPSDNLTRTGMTPTTSSVGRRGTADLVPYTIKTKSQFEQGLQASTNWTFLGSYKP